MYNKILNNNKFKEAMAQIYENENGRIFCCHGMDHSLDVARIGYIITLENNLNISKDIIYAAALLHDIGRSIECRDHNIHSAEIAQDILTECDYDTNSINVILSAIRDHRKDTNNIKSLSDVIKKADKLSRQCYNCEAYKECYWAEERKNKKIIY